MATRRLVSNADEFDQPKGKRMRFARPSFSSIVGDMMTMNSFKTTLEPWLRRVVNEEVERGLQKTMRTITRTPSFRIQALEPPPPLPSTLKLLFTNMNLPTTLFTCNRILDINNDPLQLKLVLQCGGQITPTILPYPIKVEIVVVNGDFPPSDREVWTSEEFNRKVVKERHGRRPLLTRDVNYTLRGTSYISVGDIEFTDNSSWIRSRRFRLGARVVVDEMSTTSSQGRILEALTQPFVVKDHRGEAHKKHYPPLLEDVVWRLEKISKDGKFHKRLDQECIKTVQDLLKLSVIDPTRLKTILGGERGVPDKLWDAILKHARTCPLGNKLFMSNGPNYTIILNPICQILSIEINGEIYSTSDVTGALKNEVDQWVKNAHENWNSLEEVDRLVHKGFQTSQGNMIAEYTNSQQSMMPYEIGIGGIIEVGGSQEVANNYLPMGCRGWEASPNNLM